MKHFKITIIFLVLTFSMVQLFAQNIGESNKKPTLKKVIGFQINPYLSGQTINENTVLNMVFALRGGVLLNEKFSFGVEFAGINYENFDIKAYSYNPGIYTRYLFFNRKKWHPFLEANIYYEITETKIINQSLIHDGKSSYNNSKFSYFVAPGIAIPVYKKLIRFDFMIKISSEEFFYGSYVVPSYRIQILF